MEGRQKEETAVVVTRARERGLLERVSPWAVILSGIGTVVTATVSVINLIR